MTERNVAGKIISIFVHILLKGVSEFLSKCLSKFSKIILFSTHMSDCNVALIS